MAFIQPVCCSVEFRDSIQTNLHSMVFPVLIIYIRDGKNGLRHYSDHHPMEGRNYNVKLKDGRVVDKKKVADIIW